MLMKERRVIDERSFSIPHKYEIMPDRTILRMIFPEKKMY